MTQQNTGGSGSGSQQFGKDLNINSWDDVKNAVQKVDGPQRAATFCQAVPALLNKFRTDPSRLDEIIQHIHSDGAQLLGYGSGSMGGGSR